MTLRDFSRHKYDTKDRWDGTTVGKPDGPDVYRPEFGQKVGTFLQARKDLDAATWRNKPRLMFHVPREFRGRYRPEQLANFDPEREYTVTDGGYRVCEATKKDGSPCWMAAANRQPFCEQHGGRLHPLDKASYEPQDPSTMSRIELLKNGYIDVEDLTDDELTGGFRGEKGSIVKIPHDVYQKIMRRHFERAQELLQEGLMPAVSALTSIAANSDEIYEASDRIKASTFIIERLMGKTPQPVVVGAAKEPWERLVAGMSVELTRDESRAQRMAIAGAQAPWEIVAQQQLTTDADYDGVVPSQHTHHEIVDGEVVENGSAPVVSVDLDVEKPKKAFKVKRPIQGGDGPHKVAVKRVKPKSR